MFAFVQVVFFCLDTLTSSRLSFVAAIEAHSADGANDLFSTASGAFSFPSLVAVAADPAKLPKYQDAVAIIVPDRDTEIASGGQGRFGARDQRTAFLAGSETRHRHSRDRL